MKFFSLQRPLVFFQISKSLSETGSANLTLNFLFLASPLNECALSSQLDHPFELRMLKSDLPVKTNDLHQLLTYKAKHSTQTKE
jgi:hypothetical protein